MEKRRQGKSFAAKKSFSQKREDGKKFGEKKKSFGSGSRERSERGKTNDNKRGFGEKSRDKNENNFDRKKPSRFSEKRETKNFRERKENDFEKRKPSRFSNDRNDKRKSNSHERFEGSRERSERDKTPRSTKVVERVKTRFAEKTKRTTSVAEAPEATKKRSATGKRGASGASATYKKGYQKSYEKKRKEESKETESFSGEIRLNKYLSNAGVASRREADELITAGLVSVNGKVVSELGAKIKPGDDIRFNNERLSTERKVYIIMNKPKDTITTLDDPDKRRIVTDLLLGKDLPRVYPVGRLDRNTTGVLILTNDGELSQRLMHPKYNIQKVYKATLNKNFKGEHLWELANGLELEDGFMKPDAVLMPDPTAKNEVVVELHSGKNRIVHRLFEALGYTLDKLDRAVYCGFNKKSLKRGEWRELNAKEVSQLKKLVRL